jgi:hypothetical protein
MIRCATQAFELIEYQGVPRSQMIFRGQVNSDWTISSSIVRSASGPKTEMEVICYEMATLQWLFRKNRPTLSRGYHPLEYLMHIQHHGIPTRLIDWTRDILISLFFACYDPRQEHTDKDGKVYYLWANEHQIDTVDIFTNKENVVFNGYDDHAVKMAVDEFRLLKDVVILEPLIQNPRMRYQQGVFTLGPLLTDTNKRCRPFCETMAERSQPLRSLIVLREHKEEILDELNFCYGINPSTVFVESNVTEIASRQIQQIQEMTDKSLQILRDKGLDQQAA